jgi:hypothetical protein
MGHPTYPRILSKPPLPHMKNPVSHPQLIKHQCKVTVITAVIIKIGIIRLCISFDEKFRYKITDNLSALYTPSGFPLIRMVPSVKLIQHP